MTETWKHPSMYVKAIWAGVTAFLSALLVALITLQSSGVESPAPHHLGWIEWLTIVGATLAAFGGVYGLTNAPSENSDPG